MGEPEIIWAISSGIDWAAIWSNGGPLLGVLVGGLLGVWGTLAAQTRQIRHDNAVRFHERRVQACLDFLQLVSECAVRKTLDDVQALALYRAKVAIDLLMSPEVVAAANGVRNTLQMFLATDTPTPREIAPFASAMAKRIDAFALAARQSLGVEIQKAGLRLVAADDGESSANVRRKDKQ